MSDEQPQPQPERVERVNELGQRIRDDGQVDLRSYYVGNAAPGRADAHSEKMVKKVNAEKLLPQAVAAALGQKSWQKATAPLTPNGQRYLKNALRMDVDEFRKEFAAKLRTAAEDLLELTMEEVEKIPPAARAYTLAVLVDKAQQLENKSTMAGTAVNVQINNFGSVSKEDLIRKLRGEIDELPVAAQPVEQE
jgi:hypothetical protein